MIRGLKLPPRVIEDIFATCSQDFHLRDGGFPVSQGIANNLYIDPPKCALLTKASEIRESEVVRRLIDGEIKAFDYLYNTYKRRVFGLIIKIVKLREESEGLVHDTFYRLWENRASLDESKSIQQWLFTVAYNLSIDRMRKLVQRKDYVDYVRSVASGYDLDTENKVNYSLLKEEIQKVVDTLPKQRRIIYQLSREDGLSNKEIANKLGISRNTVENQLVFVNKILKNALRSLRMFVLDIIF